GRRAPAVLTPAIAALPAAQVQPKAPLASGTAAGTLPQPEAARQRDRAAQHVFTQPQRRRPRALRDQRQRQLLIVLVEHLETVVPPVTEGRQPHDQLGQRGTVYPLTRKHP